MYREALIFGGILVICLFMTVHNNNLKSIEARNIESNEYKLSQEDYLMNQGLLIKLSNGVTIKRNANLIFIEQSDRTIILKSSDANQIIAFLEE